jgi:transposase
MGWPHLIKTFKLSNDKRFVEKVTDVIGLYLDPPDRALVLSVDEKSQIQALDRTQPGLPMKKGRAGTMTHDYKRHGTTTLFAALDVATGKVIGECMKRHRHQEWLKFLRLIDRSTPNGLDLHLIADNYATHKPSHSQSLVGQASPLPHAFHAHIGVLAQSGRTLLRLDHRRSYPLRRVHERRRTRDRYSGLSRSSQRPSDTFRLDQIRYRHSAKGRQRATSVRVTTLAPTHVRIWRSLVRRAES